MTVKVANTEIFNVQVLGSPHRLVVAVQRITRIANAQLKGERFVNEPLVDHVGFEDAGEQEELLVLAEAGVVYRWHWL